VKVPPPIQALIDRVQGLVDRVMHLRIVVRLMEIMEIYNKAGGGLLAAGLAYGALFAALTGLLFVVGLIGLFVSDPAVRADLVEKVAEQFPPLEPIVSDGLQTVAANAGAYSIIGLIGLGWSASQFYGSFDAAIGRIFRKAPARSMWNRYGRGLLAVAIIIVGLMSAIASTAIQAWFLSILPAGSEGDGARFLATFVFPLTTAVLVVVAVGLIYKLVPNMHVPWRALGPPAFVAGLILALLTQLFVFIAPRLVGGLSVFGTFAAVFATLIWLSWAFQVLLIGAAWVRERIPDTEARVEGPTRAELMAEPSA
jgi:membrane protein